MLGWNWSLPALPGSAASLRQRGSLRHTDASVESQQGNAHPWLGLGRLKVPLTFAFPSSLRTALPALKNKLQTSGRSCCCNRIILIKKRTFLIVKAAQIPFSLAERSLRLFMSFLHCLDEQRVPRAAGAHPGGGSTGGNRSARVSAMTTLTSVPAQIAQSPCATDTSLFSL